jgi:V8-like Glu-specific endopeptidase
MMPVPKQFSGGERATLRTALLDAFPMPPNFHAFMADRLNRNFFQLAPPGGTYEEQIFTLLTLANGQAWIAELVAAALETVPNNPKLREFGQAHGFSSITDVQLVDAHQRTVKAGLDFLDLNVWRTLLGQVEGWVCRIEVPLEQGGTAFGTGFLVGPSTVITNYHVLEPVFAGVNGKTTKKGYSAKPEKVRVRFDYKKLPEGVLNNGVIYKMAAANWDLDKSESFSPVDQDGPADRLDYALVRLAESAGTDPVGKKDAGTGQPRGHFVPRDPYEFAAASPLFIVQHPDAEPVKMAFDTDAIIGLNGNGTRVRYKTNTEGGSSGSPCLTQNLELVALHHAGDPNFERPADWNQGIPFGKILALMDQRDTRKYLGT